MTFADHFSARAGGYRSFRPVYGPAVLDYLASLAPREGTVWDVGTGSGQLAVGLAERFARVVATDPSVEQIKNATPHARIVYRVEPAEEPSLEPRTVDLVTVAQAAHWFAHDRFHAAVRRVAKPGAALVLLAYELMHVDPETDRVVDWYYRELVGPYWPPERIHLETGYRDLPFPFPTLAAPPLELVHEWDRDQLVGYLSTWSATVRYEKVRGEDPLARLVAALAPVWPDLREKRTVRWPLILKVGRNP